MTHDVRETIANPRGGGGGEWGDLRSGAPRIQSQTMEKRESGMKSSYLWLILCLCSMINNSFVSIFMQFSVVVKIRGAFGAVLVVLWVDVVANLLSPYPVSNVNRRETTRSRPNRQLDHGPGSEIGAGWKIGVTWSRKLGFKMAATELGYLLTKSPFWLSLWHDISISWHGCK